MALPATYGFDDAIETLSSDFTVQVGGPRCDGASKGRGGLEYNGAFWNADPFADDQYAQVTGNTAFHGPAVRCSSGANGYVVFASSLTSVATKMVAGVQTNIGALTNPTDGQLTRVEVEGAVIRVYHDGVQADSGITDSTFSSGSAGWWTYDGTGRVDDFEGGNLSAGGGSVLPLIAVDMANMADMRGMRG